MMQNKERAEFLGRIAFYCFLGSNTFTAIIEVRACVRRCLECRIISCFRT